MDEAIKTLPDLLDGQRVAMLTLDSHAGMDSRPLTVQRVDDGAVWFLVSDHTPWLSDLGPANLAVSDDKLWLSATGTAERVDDPAVIEDLGNPITSAWFADGDQPVALRVDVERGEWWEAPTFMRTAFGVAKAKLTGDVPEVGEHGRIAPELS